MTRSHLYSLRLSYSRLWTVGDDERFGLMEGPCTGTIAGTFVGANRAHVRPDGGYLPRVHGAIETDDGATLLFELRGRGRVDEQGSFRASCAVTHVTADDRYARLNDVVCSGEASSGPDDEEIVLEVYETVGGAAPS